MKEFQLEILPRTPLICLPCWLEQYNSPTESPPISVLSMTLNHLMVRLQSWSLGNMEYPFINITPKSTLTWGGSTCNGSLYYSNKTFQLFTKDYYYRAKSGWPARTYIQQLCEDTGCSPEELPEAMNDRENWRERVRDIRASGTTWWWWWFVLDRNTW